MTRRHLGRLRRDDGTTLIELLVGMTLMLIFMGMFTGAIVMMNTAMNKTQAVNEAASQSTVAFESLDTLVRYAAAISTPGVSKRAKGSAGNWYVELRTTNTGAESCTQLRVDSKAQQLQRRTWTVLNAVASAPGAWVPIASGISNGRAVPGPSTQPFYLPPLGPNTAIQQLTVNLVSSAGSVTALTSSESSYTLTAVNSAGAPVAPVCQEQGRP
ncbi:MAG: hypothetical protein ABWZ98_10935 [Nakamurella sp.]